MLLTQSRRFNKFGIGSWFNEAWSLISELGANSVDGPYLSRKVKLANQVAVVLLIFGLGLTGGFLAYELHNLPSTGSFYFLLLYGVFPS